MISLDKRNRVRYTVYVKEKDRRCLRAVGIPFWEGIAMEKYVKPVMDVELFVGDVITESNETPILPFSHSESPNFD